MRGFPKEKKRVEKVAGIKKGRFVYKQNRRTLYTGRVRGLGNQAR